MYLFGAFMIWAAWRMWRGQDGPSAPEQNFLSHRLHGWLGASSFLTILITLELSDVTFAFDSVPAVLAVTRDPFLAYTSNVFAVLGLRALYFLLAGALERCWLLHYGLALLLGVVGLKMLASGFYQPGIGLSLGVVAVIMFGSIAGSLLIKRPAREVH